MSKISVSAKGSEFDQTIDTETGLWFGMGHVGPEHVEEVRKIQARFGHKHVWYCTDGRVFRGAVDISRPRG